MDEEWIDAVLRLNGAIVAAEASFNEQVISLVETADQGQDTNEAEGLLQEQRKKLVLLRSLQARFLQEPSEQE